MVSPAKPDYGVEFARVRAGETDGAVVWVKGVWRVPPTPSEDGGHPVPFPLEIPRRLIALFVHRNNARTLPAPVVLDPFAGIGTTALAAREAGHRFFGCDLSPAYAALAREALGIR